MSQVSCCRAADPRTLDLYEGGVTMSVSPDVGVTKGRTIPFYRAIPRLLREPVTELSKMGMEHEGQPVRIGIGPFRPYLISHPGHVQQVLKTDWKNFQREGMFWNAVWRLTGYGIISEGETWETSRKILAPLFTARYIATLGEKMAATISKSVSQLDRYAESGEVIDSSHKMNVIVNHVIIDVLFGGRIPRETGERLAPEFEICATSIAVRLLLPFVSDSIRLPGDRAFLTSMKKIDDIVYPLIERARTEKNDANDVLSAVLRARIAEHGEATDMRQLRDDVVSIYGTASETTSMTLTWFWGVIQAHPEVYARLEEEIVRVTGGGPVKSEHIDEMKYLYMVLQELLRIYPAGWLVPRQAVKDTVVGGVKIKAGAQVLISPFTTHRLEEYWDKPMEFNPERFSPERHARRERRHRYSYFPFGVGAHVCLGQQLFFMEASLIIANLILR